MKKRWVFLITMLSFLLCRFGIRYLTEPFLLSDFLPEENWTAVTVSQENPGTWESEMVDGDLDKILRLLDLTVVDRAPEFRVLDQPYFELWLHSPHRARTLIYVLEDGRIAVAVAMDTENYRYLEGGRNLYSALRDLLPDAS